jgi:hypothetical protein
MFLFVVSVLLYSVFLNELICIAGFGRLGIGTSAKIIE